MVASRWLADFSDELSDVIVCRLIEALAKQLGLHSLLKQLRGRQLAFFHGAIEIVRQIDLDAGHAPKYA